MPSPTAIAAYLALFSAIGLGFLFGNLLLGRICRPNSPNKEKLEVYECGEPTIGSSFVQFDLRFYVVALLFIIFDVEVAFFFPWANVFGKATNLMDPHLQTVVAKSTDKPGVERLELTEDAKGLYRELGVNNPRLPGISRVTADATSPADPKSAAAPQTLAEQEQGAIVATARRLAWLSMLDIGAFFAVLMVGFAYVWRRGDLDWVRAVSRERALQLDGTRRPVEAEHEPLISA